MEPIEIDNIEVTDEVLKITYWISGYKELQSVIFFTEDYQKWLQNNRAISIDAYWDHWDKALNQGLASKIVHEDLKQYLLFRYGMVRPQIDQSAPSYTDKKPMTRVSKSKGGKKDSRSA